MGKQVVGMTRLAADPVETRLRMGNLYDVGCRLELPLSGKSVEVGDNRRFSNPCGMLNDECGMAMQERTQQIAATDKQLDQLVHKLCGLTEDEIRIVEGRER